MNASYDLMMSFTYVCILLLVVSPLFTLIINKERKWLFSVGIVSITISLSFLWFIAYVLDEFGVSMSWLFFVAFFVLAGVFDLPVILRHRSKTGFTLIIVFVLGIFAFYFIDFSPTKPFHRFHNAIQVGMTTNEVMAALHFEFPDKGRFPVPVLNQDTNRFIFILDPTKQAYNAEDVFVTLQDGRVTGKQYSAD
jgi:hypothetical protein